MQSDYLCVIIHVKQLPFLVVLTWFLILCNIQDGGKDGDHCWWRNRPPAAPPFINVKKIKGFSVQAKSLRNTATYQKLWGKVPSTILLYHGGGYDFASTSEGYSWQGSGWFCMRLHFFIKASFIIDTKGLYCVTKGNISFSSLLFCFRSAAFLLCVLLLTAIFLSKLCGQPLSMHQPLFEIWNTSVSV